MLLENKHTALGFIKNLYTPISLIFIIVFAWNNRLLLAGLLETANAARICLAIALWCVAHLLSPLFAHTVLTGANRSITYSRLLRIHAARLPARYLPGGIWHTVGRVADLHLAGVNKKWLTILVAAESAIPCLTTFAIGGGYLWYSGAGGAYNFVFGLFCAGSLVAALIIPKLSSKYIGLDKGTLRSYCKSFLVTILFWAIAASSFTAYFLSFPLTGSEISFLEIPAAYMFSWGIGFIAIFAPQGLGVFEYVAGTILKLPTTLSGTIVVIAGFRLVNLIADLTIWSACHVFAGATPAGKDS